MKSRILILAAILAVVVFGRPAAHAENFYAIASVSTSTSADDFYAGINLIQGAGVGFDANSPHDALPGAGADMLWVTAAPGGFPSDYIEVAGAPIITLDLGFDVDLDEISTWGYSDGNANGVSEFSLRFATDADGPSGFGTSITFNPTYTMDFPATPRQSNLFGQVLTARYVEFTGLDNFFVPPGDGTGGPPGLAGGDRVGLGEIAFRADSPQQLLLEIDRVTGNFTLSNPRLDQTPMMSGYDLTSAVGGMDPSQWLSIAENYDADSGPPFFDPNNNWLEFGATPEDIAEGTLGTAALAPGTSIDLGNMWIKNPNEDVVVDVLLEDGTVLNPLVQFVGNSDMSYELADLNFDNAINELDWPIYRDGYRQDLTGLSGAEGYQMGDLNFDGQNNAVDFGLFKTAYDAVNGAGSFDRMLAGVPEPATGAVLLLFAVAALAMSRLRRNRRVIAMLVCGSFIVMAATQPASAVIVAHWDFENPADLGNDIAGGHNQVAAGADVMAGPGRVGAGSVSLDGTGTGIEVVRDDGVVDFGTMTTMSVTAFINPDAIGGLQRVFGALGFGGGTNDGWGMGLNGDNMRYTTYAVQDYDLEASYVAGEWQHFAVVINEGDATFYQDGSNIGTITGGNPTATSNPYHIGSSAFNGPEPFIGDIDDLRVYDNPLTDSDVFELASIGTPNLTLRVNTISGNVSIINDNTDLGVAVDFDIDLYEIVSDGQLLPTGWDSIQDNGQNGFPQGDGTGNGWEELGTPSVDFLGEAYLDGSSLIADQDVINLGTAFNTSDLGGGSGTGDLEFSFRLSSGTLRTGLVKYVDIGFFEADFNRDGSVDGDDFLAWQTGFGTQSGAEKMDGDYDNDEDVDGDDFLGWQDEFGSSSGGDGASAVPEPSTLGLLGLMVVGLSLSWMRRNKGAQIMKSSSLLAIALSLSIAASALASTTNDRVYQLGDDPAESSSAGGNVSLTLDNAVPAAGSQQDLFSILSAPTYVDVGPSGLGRPDASSGELGVQFDGSSLEYLEGDRLGLPETSVASTVQGGPLDYTGIANRGFQLWVYPTVGANTEDQHIVMDTLQHGVGIAADGTWFMQYAGAARASSVAVTTDLWYHVMVVRPFGPSGGSRMYVDGVAVVATGGGYTGTDETVLTLGANTGDNFDTIPGLSNFFTGTVDDLEMFVMGTSIDTATDYGTFDLGTDNAFIAAQGLVDGDLTGDGQVLGDGSGGPNDDVAVFVDNWKAEKLLAGVRVGDLVSRNAGDFNYDGITDLLDWHVLRINHENPGNIPSLGSLLAGVPEPTTFALATLLAACACWRRRKDW